ncbi:MAG: FGGY-family carbohydrate kinase [Acidimicrobiia bacterium]|nr:MAG: FGGY-family carbohydrate kinase [Acidimicrobiia bacterium]
MPDSGTREREPLAWTGIVRPVKASAFVLAIDLGTSGPKVALVSSRGEIMGKATEPVPLLLDGSGGAEQDPQAWWDAIVTATRAAIDSSPGIDVAAVSVTSQWSGTVAVDGNGEPIGNAIIWMDSRGAPYLHDLTGSGPVRFEGFGPLRVRRWISTTGGAPSGSGKDPIAHILYLRNEQPDVYRRAETFLEPKDYLNLRLTGRTVASYDSIALHWLTDNRNPDAVEYHDDLLVYAGLKRSQLPELVHATEVIGGLSETAADDLGLTAGTPVIAGTPDVSSAAIGAGTVRDHAAHLYIGTSSWLTCHVPYKKTDLFHSIASLPAAVPGKWFVANEQETAGKAIDWLASVLYPNRPTDDSMYRELNDIANTVPAGSNGVVFTPWLYGERTPVEDSKLRAGFFNQSLDTGRDEMIRAVFEGVAYNTRWLLETVERFTKRRLDPISMVGGGAQSDLWAQIHADVLDRTILQRGEPLWVNVRGAGMLAHAALGNVAWEDIDKTAPTAAERRPDPVNRPVYDAGYDTFRKIHKANRGIYRRINA